MAAVPVPARSRFFNSILVLLRCCSTCSVTVPGYLIGETAKSDSANNHHLAEGLHTPRLRDTQLSAISELTLSLGRRWNAGWHELGGKSLKTLAAD